MFTQEYKIEEKIIGHNELIQQHLGRERIVSGVPQSNLLALVLEEIEEIQTDHLLLMQEIILTWLQVMEIEKSTLDDRTYISTITQSKRSKRLEEKPGGQNYQCGQVQGFATRKKVILSELDSGTSQNTSSIFNFIPDDMLVSLATICYIDMGVDSAECTNNLSQLRMLDALRAGGID